MKDYPDEQITILNNAFFHKKSYISFKYLDFKRKAGNSLYVLSSKHITKLSNLGLSTDSMKYLDGFLQYEDTNFESSYHVLAKVWKIMCLSKKKSEFIICLS